MPGLLALNGGDEFKPGNEAQDRELIAAAGPGPAYVVATAAARQRPDMAVATARRWFDSLGLVIEELPVYKRSEAGSTELAAQAAGAGLLYLAGGDPGLLATTLRGSWVWAGMVRAWQGGAALAGSSAGAMALCQWTLVMARWPRHHERKTVAALGLVAGTAVLPHYENMGSRWSLAEAPEGMTLLGLDERTAAVWDGAGWHASGSGAVTVIAHDETRRYQTGEGLEGLPPPAAPA